MQREQGWTSLGCMLKAGFKGGGQLPPFPLVGQFSGRQLRARSSVVEHTLHTGGVAGSIPAAPTIANLDRSGPIWRGETLTKARLALVLPAFPGNR